MHPESRPPATADPALNAAAWAAILAPLAAVALKQPTAGWLVIGMMISFPIWILGYACVVVPAAVGMLRRGGSLRRPGHRTRAIIWAWLTSVGVVVVGLAIVDGGDTSESVASTLSLMLGSTGSDSPVNDVSNAIAGVAVIAWLGGWLALLVEWMVSAVRARPEAPRVAPPVAQP